MDEHGPCCGHRQASGTQTKYLASPQGVSLIMAISETSGESERERGSTVSGELFKKRKVCLCVLLKRTCIHGVCVCVAMCVSIPRH